MNNWIVDSCEAGTPADAKLGFAASQQGCARSYIAGSASVLAGWNGPIQTSLLGKEKVSQACKNGNFAECQATNPEIFPSPTGAGSCAGRTTIKNLAAECPTGGCIYTPRLDPCGLKIDTFGRIAGASRPKCDKTAWDEHYLVPCCLGLVDSNPTLSSVSDALCDPRWCPSDPAGVCSVKLEQTCSALFTDPGGNKLPLVMQQSHPCNVWYNQALSAGYGTRVAAVDKIVVDFCGQNPESPACACFLAASGGTASCASPPCDVPFTSLSDGTVKPIGFADGSANPVIPINVVDRVCLEPSCGSRGVLETYSIRKQLEMCPQQVCVQILENTNIGIDTIKASGIYIDVQDLVCKNGATQTSGSPLPRSGADSYAMMMPLASDGKLIQDESYDLRVFNMAPAGSPSFDFVTSVEPSIEGIDGISVSPLTQQSAAPGGVPANVTFRVS